MTSSDTCASNTLQRRGTSFSIRSGCSDESAIKSTCSEEAKKENQTEIWQYNVVSTKVQIGRAHV